MKKMRRNDKCGSVSLQMKNQAGNYSDQEKKFKEGKFCVLSMKQPVQVSQRERGIGIGSHVVIQILENCNLLNGNHCNYTSVQRINIFLH